MTRVTDDRARIHAVRAASFDRGADVYARARPAYPADATAFLVPPGAHRVLDLAAGTGLLTQGLVARGLDVVAVDPAPAMLAHLAAALPRVEALRGTAERIPLPDDAVDAVVVAQAWHWFDEAAAAAEVARVLRPGGSLGVVWNDRDESVDWVARFGEILRGASGADGPDERSPDPGSAFEAPEQASFTWSDVVTPDGLRALAASRSYVISLDEDARAALLARVDELAATHPLLAGREAFPLPYVTVCWRFPLR